MRNEDAYVFEPPLFAIADGMGGARAGEIAAGIAAAALREGARGRHRRAEPPGDHRGGEPSRVGARARGPEHGRDGHHGHGRARRRRGRPRSCSGTSATRARIGCATASSSRSRRITRSSRSSSQSGVLTPEEAERHPQRSAITRAVGTESAIEVDVFTVPAEPGDLVLLCSDGLTDMLTEEEIASALVDSERDPSRAAEALVAAANASGGEDNVTVVLFEIVGADDAADARRAHDGTRATRTARRHVAAPETDGRSRGAVEVVAPPARRRAWRPRRRAGPHRGRARARPRRPLRRDPAVTARNRELFGLVVAGLLAGTALATITLARDSELTPNALTYAALFLGLYVAAHVVVRLTVPYADGALLPIAAVLTAFGLVMNYRLDPTGGRQALWVLIGVAVFCAVLFLLRHDYRVLESYRYLFGVAAVALLLLPSLPVIGERVNGVRLWVDLGPLQFQPGELAKICLVVFLAGYLREKREVLAQGRAEGLRAAARDLGRRDARHRPDERPRERAAQLRDLPRDAVRRDRQGALRRRRARALLRRRDPALHRDRPRAERASRSGSRPGRTSRCTARRTASSCSGRSATRTSS